MPRSSHEKICARNRVWFPSFRPAHEVYLELARGVLPPQGLALHLGAGRDAMRIEEQLGAERLISLDVDGAGLSLNSNVRRTAADGARLPFHDTAFDLILCEHVFEHLEKPEEVLKECHRALKPGGALVFLTPNRFSYISLAAALSPYRFHVWFKGKTLSTAKGDVFPTYYRLNSPGRIRKLARRTGFEVEAQRSFVGWPTYWEFSDLVHRAAVVGHWLLERCPCLFHISLAGVLRKPLAM